MRLADAAIDQTKKGGDMQKAQVFALLAVADALQEIAASIDALKKDFVTIEVLKG